MLRVRVLGELALELDGRPLEPAASRRARSLLGLLAVERKAHPRAQLAARFWPDVLDESARTSLRSALSALRRSLGPDADRYLLAGRETVSLADGELVWTDIAEFEALVASGRVEEALELARGDLLEGIDDEWVYERRDEHRERIREVLERLAADADAAGDPQRAVALTRRRVALDPLAEDAQRDLIRRLAAAGDRAAAMAAYKRLQDRLRSELGIAPSAATRELVESLRSDDVAAPVEPPAPPAAPAAAPRERAPGTVTLLFTDQVSSTETLQRLGDDEAERLRRTHFRLLRDVADAHGGQEVKNLGDGLMVAFTSAVDAVACSIGIQQAVHRHAEREGDDSLSVRVGLNVGEPIRDEDDYFGTPVVVAKRLCDSAAAGQILASDVVRALVGTRGGFEFRPLGEVGLKGIAEPVAACEVGWQPTTAQRIPLPPAVAMTPPTAFVGRDDALAELEREWAVVVEGRRRVVLLAGEPGIGKTRLAAEFSRAAHDRGAAVLAGRCYEEALVPYQPFTEALAHYVSACPPAELTVQVAPRRRELARLVPELGDPGEPAEEGGADRERFRLFEAVSSLLAEAALARPTVLLLDDLHWADAATLLLLRHAVRTTESAPLMLLATYRATELDPRGELAAALAEMRRARAVAELALPGLGEDEVAALISAQSGAAAQAGFVRGVAARTAGNPFFIEELLRHVGDADAWSDDDPVLPESVKDLLRRRLDRLGEESRRALAIGAVAGPEFDLDVLAVVMETSADALIDLLEGAVAGQVLVEQPGAFGRFAFAHPLIRETIEQELSATRRALLHRRIGDAIESVFADRLGERAGELARHYHAAGDAAKAYDYHRQAAAAAEAVFALDTAREHLDGAVAAAELLGLRPEDDPPLRDVLLRRASWRTFKDLEGAREELLRLLDVARAANDRPTEMNVLNAIGHTWHISDSARSIEYHERALALAEELGDELGQVHALNRLSIASSNRMDFRRARELSEQALALARRTGDRTAEGRALDGLKLVALQLGDVPTLVELTDRLERVQREEQDYWYLQWTLLEGAFAPIATGRFDDADARLTETLSLYERVGDPWSLSLILNARCWLERSRGDHATALRAGRRGVEAAHERSDSLLGWTAGTLGCTLLALHALPEAREVLERGLAAADRFDAAPQVFACLGPLAWVRRRLGDEAAARELGGRAERMIESLEVPPGHAHLYGWGGYSYPARLALADGDADRAEAIVARFLEPAERAGVREAAADGLALLGAAAELRADRDAARGLYERSLDAAAGGGLHEQRRAAHTGLARLAAAAGDSGAAERHANAARELIDAVAASVGDDQLAAGFRAEATAELDSALAGGSAQATS